MDFHNVIVFCAPGNFAAMINIWNGVSDRFWCLLTLCFYNVMLPCSFASGIANIPMFVRGTVCWWLFCSHGDDCSRCLWREGLPLSTGWAPSFHELHGDHPSSWLGEFSLQWHLLSWWLYSSCSSQHLWLSLRLDCSLLMPFINLFVKSVIHLGPLFALCAKCILMQNLTKDF